MKFNPNTSELFTDSGDLIKDLHCPLQKQWAQMHRSTANSHRRCDECSRTVLDTSFMNEDEVLAAVRANSSTCLCVSMRQANIQIAPFLSAEPSDPADSR